MLTCYHCQTEMEPVTSRKPDGFLQTKYNCQCGKAEPQVEDTLDPESRALLEEIFVQPASDPKPVPIKYAPNLTPSSVPKSGWDAPDSELVKDLQERIKKIEKTQASIGEPRITIPTYTPPDSEPVEIVSTGKNWTVTLPTNGKHWKVTLPDGFTSYRPLGAKEIEEIKKDLEITDE